MFNVVLLLMFVLSCLFVNEFHKTKRCPLPMMLVASSVRLEQNNMEHAFTAFASFRADTATDQLIGGRNKIEVLLHVSNVFSGVL